MMYGKPVNFEKDFITRTLEIVNNYHEEYDVTLFVNALVGLLIIPKERYLNKVTDDIIEKELLEKVQQSVSKPQKCDLKTIVRRMRNAVSHAHLEFEAEKDSFGKAGKEIKRVSFYDGNSISKKDEEYKEASFKATFDFALLKEFILSFSKAALNLMEE